MQLFITASPSCNVSSAHISRFLLGHKCKRTLGMYALVCWWFDWFSCLHKQWAHPLETHMLCHLLRPGVGMVKGGGGIIPVRVEQTGR